MILKCVNVEESKTMIKEMHAGVCGGHYAIRTTAAKIMRVGYYCRILLASPFQGCALFCKNMSRVSVFLNKTQVVSFAAKPSCNRNSFSIIGYGFYWAL